ncbi:MAG: 30S ribosomal protein S20 [Armatimonadota bacterium]|nr:30S ribosomal protein S20 [Armatimonadota bacterium]
MPNIKSVIKDVKRSQQRRLRNQATKSQIKTYVKKARAIIADTDAQPDSVSATVSKTVSVIDKAFKRGIIHKNAAARRKSRLMKRVAKAAQTASA